MMGAMETAHMFAFVLGGVRRALGRVFDAHYRVLAGLAFMALAMAAIQYDEIVAPGFGRISDALGSATGDIGRKLADLHT
jgi:hypothetical protein